MEKYVGLWIDHKQAVIVSLLDGAESITHLKSNIEGHFRLSGGSRSSTPYGSKSVAPEKKIEARHVNHLHQYYQKVIHEIRDAEKVLIVGPGEAKKELEKELKKSKELSPAIVGVQPADKMTDNQIAAAVREYFYVKGE
jgi:hypothetical protein